jgi:hypothetical protein
MNEFTNDPSSWPALAPIRDERLGRAVQRVFEHGKALVERHAATDRMLIVLVSRRMTCLYHMLKSAGLVDFRDAEVVSDRAINSSSIDLRNRSVLLLDDAFILGSTFADLYDDLTQPDRGAKVIALVACVDEERYSRALLAHVGIEISADGPEFCTTKELERFGLDLARCLYRAGIPYFTDFPVVRKLSIRDDALDVILRGDRWYVADVTPVPEFAGPGRRAYSLIPRDFVAKSIRSRLAGSVGTIAELLKVRLYVSRSGGEQTMQIVPIGVPGAVMLDRLNRELESIAEALTHAKGRFNWRSWDPAAKHRLLQMYLSTAVLAEVWREVGPLVGQSLNQDVLERGHVELYFGEQDRDAVLGAFDAAVAAYIDAADDPAWPGMDPPIVPKSGLGDHPEVRRGLSTSSVFVETAAELRDSMEVLRATVPPGPPARSEICVVDRFWVHEVLEVFGLVDERLERPQELSLRVYDYDRYDRYRKADGDETLGPRIIKQGITVNELSRLLAPNFYASDEWERVVFSLAIDVGNDLGVVVPSTKAIDKNGPVFRQYRSGETAFLVSRAYAELERGEPEVLAQTLDWYTAEVLKVDFADDIESFIRDVRRIDAASLQGGELLQIWDGVVTKVTETHVELDVASRLNDDADSARLELGLFGPADRRALARDSRVEWIVVDRVDERGRPHRHASVRVLPSAS